MSVEKTAKTTNGAASLSSANGGIVLRLLTCANCGAVVQPGAGSKPCRVCGGTQFVWADGATSEAKCA